MSYLPWNYYHHDPVAAFDLLQKELTGKLENRISQVDGLYAQNKRLTNILQAILDADERGQGLPFAEALALAAKQIGWKST